MKTWMLLSMAVAVLVLLSSGCGEGPLYMEDARALTAGDSSEDENSEKPEEEQRSDLKHDPDQKRRIDEEKKQQEEEEEEEEVKEEAAKTSVQAIDDIGGLLNKHKIEEAKKMFDDNRHLIQQTADEGMQSENPEVGKLYKQWWDTLLEMRNMLDREDWSAEKISREGINTLVAAGRFKQAARQAGIYER